MTAITLELDANAALMVAMALRDRAAYCDRLAGQQPFRPETPRWGESYRNEAVTLRAFADTVIHNWNAAHAAEWAELTRLAKGAA